MPHCPFCGYLVNEMDMICPNCKSRLPDNFLQVKSNQFKSQENEFLEFNENRTNQYQQNYPPPQYQTQYPPPQYQTQYPQPYYQNEYPPVKKKRSKVRVVSSILGVLVILILVLAIFQFDKLDRIEEFFNDMFDPTPYTEYPESVEFTVERSTTISCIRGNASYELRIPKPKSLRIDDNGNKEYLQEVVSVSATGDYTENGYWYNWKNDIAGGGKHDIKITYRIKAKTYQWNIDESKSGKVSDIPKTYTDRYSSTKDEWYIETTNPTVKSLARQLTEDKTNVYEKVKAIYEYLKENVVYVVHNEPQSCTSTLQTMSGDCDDQSILFCALCRSVGIPAWLELGFVYDKTQQQWGGHGWATVCIPKKDGYIATPHVDVVNSRFLWEDCYRITEWIDDGNAENLKNYYNYFNSTLRNGAKLIISETPNFYTSSLKTSGTIKIPVET